MERHRLVIFLSLIICSASAYSDSQSSLENIAGDHFQHEKSSMGVVDLFMVVDRLSRTPVKNPSKVGSSPGEKYSKDDIFSGTERIFLEETATESPDDCLQLSGPETLGLLQIGSRVARGADWIWGDQDGNPPREGRVVSIIPHLGWVEVLWGNGNQNGYRMGSEGKYDLRILDCPSPSISSNASTTVNYSEPLKFHQVHGRNVRISADGLVAERRRDFRDALVFSNRPIRINEKFRLRILGAQRHWGGNLIIGFTNQDPLSLRGNLPRQLTDTTSRNGFWAKGMFDYEQDLLRKNTVVQFHIRPTGEVRLGIDGEDKGNFLSGVDTEKPLWALANVYGQTVKVELLVDSP